ncbi:MAG: virulence RhuM family protein [Neisseriaceae bacterium]|nr:virulence RhuM family protein [Neisseriaceae bacterium]
MSNHIKSDFYLFSSADGKISVDVRFDGETVWLSLEQMANLFERDKSTVSRHIKNVFSENELDENSVVANFATTARDGKTYQVEHFNLDVIISVGYRVKSLRGTQFRQWATKRLNEYIRKGFTLDDERLKNGSGRYFKELLQRIRDIRSSERNLYQQVTDIFATSIDYDKNSPLTKNFFATVQNKLHFAAHNHTAAEIIFQRANQNQPLMGMTNFSGNYITKSDVGIAKNYLNEKELQILNLLVSRFLDYAELQALEEKTMTMQNWTDELDRQILNDNRPLLSDKGSISHKQAIEKAEKEFIAYRQKEMQQLESDFDKVIKKIVKKK